MKEFVEYFGDRNILFPKLIVLNNKELGIKSKITIYKGEDLKKNYCAIFHINRKSRFIRKDVDVLESIADKLKLYFEHNFARKMLWIQAPFCSKAQVLIKQNKWEIFK
jgi:hypothetical protein